MVNNHPAAKKQHKNGTGKALLHKVILKFETQYLEYTAKNQKLLKTGCKNVVGATLFNVVNNIVRHCYT